MVLVFLLSAVSAQQPGAGHSRLFPPSDLGLLDAPIAICGSGPI